MIYNRNRLYSRAIHCHANTEMHYVNGSYLRACMKLRIVQKNRFSLHESGWTKAWCPGLGINNKPSTSCHWYLWFGTRLRHQTRAPWLGPPWLMKAKSNFFTNRNILCTLKKEPLNIMLLHTSRTVWCLGRVPKHRNQWQEVEGLLFSPQNSQLVHILSFHS